MMEEWGFKEYTAAENFLKSRRRQQSHQNRHREHARLRDPEKRLEKFRQTRQRTGGFFAMRPAAAGPLSSRKATSSHGSPTNAPTVSSPASTVTRRCVKASTRSIKVRSRTEAAVQSEVRRSQERVQDTGGGALNSRNLKVDNDSNVRIIRDNRQRKVVASRRIAWG